MPVRYVVSKFTYSKFHTNLTRFCWFTAIYNGVQFLLGNSLVYNTLTLAVPDSRHRHTCNLFMWLPVSRHWKDWPAPATSLNDPSIVSTPLLTTTFSAVPVCIGRHRCGWGQSNSCFGVWPNSMICVSTATRSLASFILQNEKNCYSQWRLDITNYSVYREMFRLHGNLEDSCI